MKLILLLFSSILANLHIAQAQQPAKPPRIGLVSRDGDLDQPGTRVEAFRRALREIGYTEGKNILVEYRYISGMTGQIERLVTELLQQKVDVLILTPPASDPCGQASDKDGPYCHGDNSGSSGGRIRQQPG